MTTAHRPTFDPAVGKEAPKGPAYHQRLLPAHTHLKFRQAGQGGNADSEVRDLRAELLAAEAAHFAKVRGEPAAIDAAPSDSVMTDSAPPPAKKRILDGNVGDDDGGGGGEGGEEDPAAKRRRILAETRDIDADDSEDDDDDDGDDDKDAENNDDSDSESDSDSSDSDSDSDEDETAELQRELERIKRERAEKKEREEREREAAEEEERVRDIARGNPLLNKADAHGTTKRRWDDDVVFKNQARGTDDKGKQKEFINDLLRSDFHKRFMGKYVR